MDKAKAEKMGRAFRLGAAYGTGISLAMDDAQWITVKPNGAESKGSQKEYGRCH